MVVVGGGFAGLAAAVRLGRGGVRVTVLERRPFLGGRAYSFADPVTGDVIDNGPHALMGAYTEALDFLGEIGAGDKLAMQPRLHVAMADPTDGLAAIAAPPLPGPLQAPAALLRYRLLGRGDRLRLVGGALRLVARAARRPDALAGVTVAEALVAAGQSPASRARFWDPLAIATLNEDPARAAAAPFAAVMRRAFLSGAAAARFALAAVPLSALYTTDAERAVADAGGTVRTGASVATLALDGSRVTGVLLKDGTRLDADAVVLAVPCGALLRLLPSALRALPAFRALEAIGTSPIVSVHLWLDRPVAWGSPFLGLLGTETQWLFDCGPTAAGGCRLATVTSGAHAWNDLDDAVITGRVLADAGAVLPALRRAGVRRSLVIRERHATISLTPAADAVRPPADTPIPNLLLAGDWIRTGLPATIESAVQSGRAAAARALSVAART